MNWFWLNIPVSAVFFLVMAGIPLLMVIRHPDRRPAATAGQGAGSQAETVMVAGITAAPAVAAGICDRRELVGASAGDRG